MTPMPEAVQAAPNRSEIRARVLEVEQSADFSDKWYFELEILESRKIEGGNFAPVGKRLRAYSIGNIPKVLPGSYIKAVGEYLGDERGGMFRLESVSVED